VHDLLADLLLEAMYLALWLSLPPLGVAMLVALAIGLVQSLTQLSEPALNAIPRALAVGVSLALTGGWIGGQLGAFTTRLFKLLPELVR
jgi:flagellar biosynthesis protein FliQ